MDPKFETLRHGDDCSEQGFGLGVELPVPKMPCGRVHMGPDGCHRDLRNGVVVLAEKIKPAVNKLTLRNAG